MCETHRKRARRYGDPRLSHCLTKAELLPYLRQVRRIIRRGNQEKVETALAKIKQKLADSVHDELAERATWIFRGPLWVLQALEEIKRVVPDVDAIESGILIAACFVSRMHEPRRWPSDRAFVFDLVRSWRKQTNLVSRSYWSAAKQRPIKTYQELRPATVETIGEMLIDAYKTLVAHILQASKALLSEPSETKALLADGLPTASE